MDQENPQQNIPYESISSSMPTFESFTSQQNVILEVSFYLIFVFLAYINLFKDKVGNKLSGGEDELKKYLKEPRLELEDDEDFDILTWWKSVGGDRAFEETPKRADFEVCRKVVQFLEKFKGTTELVSNVSSPVAHLWFGEVLDIDKHLREWQANSTFKDMIVDMRKKYDKYWGDYKKINHYMYFAVILDPTMKSEIIGYGFKHLIENGCMPMEQDEEDSQETAFDFLTPDELCKKFVQKVEKDMGSLFAIYKEKYGTTTSTELPRSTSSKSTSSRSRRGNAFLNSFKDKVGNKLSGGEDELKKYLKEPRLELEDDEDFDILTWWKINSPRFPIIARMAKDILCIQVSTVASESAFSASGRVLDPYRNSLAPNIVEALVCTQDWIRTSSRNITMDTLEDLMKDDELAKEIQEGLDKQKEEQTQGKEKNVQA
ncbi:zinc finger BED domain-containing protein RICESLEEPER 2 [Tanacetum coccineum]